MPGLLSLANELISNISDQLDTRKTFRSTCRRINAVVSPRVFSYLVIDIHEKRIDVSISQLETLAAGSTGVAKYVRTVGIRRLVPDYNRSAHESGYVHSNGNVVAVDEGARDPKMDWRLEKMGELLPKALSTLNGARTVVWETFNRNPGWVSLLVSKFIETLPALDTLHLEVVESFGWPKLYLDRVMNLTELSLKNHPNTDIAEIIASSPHLTRLDLQADMYRAVDSTEPLQDLLRKVPCGRPLHLEHLSIGGHHVRFDPETLPHLRHLRSLEFYSNPYIPVDERQKYSERSLSKSDRFGSSSSDLWEAVGREEIPIEAVLSQADEAVIQYLALASGIKKISLLDADSDVLANKFFTQVVPRHSGTLVSLSISANFEGRWCFGRHNMDILLECTRLAELAIAIDSSGTEQVTLHDIVIQIMGVAAQMPNLWRLELLPACRKELRDVGAMNLMLWHQENTARALCELVTSFGPVVPAIHPSMVLVRMKLRFQSVSSSKFRFQCGANGVVKYVQY